MGKVHGEPVKGAPAAREVDGLRAVVNAMPASAWMHALAETRRNRDFAKVSGGSRQGWNPPMRVRSLLILAVLLGAFAPHTLGAAEETEPSAEIICEREFKIVSPTDELKGLGRYAVKAIRREEVARIEIFETLSLAYRGKRVTLSSSMVYRTDPAVEPLKATAETMVEGKTCMTGVVEFGEKTVTASCTGHLDPRTGKEITPPTEYSWDDVPKPEGALIFQAAVPVLAPQLLPTTGVLDDVVFVEFPDDIAAPELVNFKEGCRLVRSEPDKDGVCWIRMLSAHTGTPTIEVAFDRENRLFSFPTLGKLKLVEVKEKAKESATAGSSAEVPPGQ